MHDPEVVLIAILKVIDVGFEVGMISSFSCSVTHLDTTVLHAPVSMLKIVYTFYKKQLPTGSHLLT